MTIDAYPRYHSIMITYDLIGPLRLDGPLHMESAQWKTHLLRGRVPVPPLLTATPNTLHRAA